MLPPSKKDLVSQNKQLHEQLAEAQETLSAIQHGEIDALVVSTPKGPQVYTISGAEKPYRLLIEQMSEGAVMLSQDNTILYCNSGFAGIVKHPINRLIGSSIQDMVAPAHIERFRQLLALDEAGEATRKKQITFQASDGSLVPTQVSINTLVTGGVKTIFLVVTDLTRHMEEDLKHYTASLEREITERKKAEQKLLEAKKQAEQDRRNLYTTLEVFPFAVVIVEKSANEVIYANKPASELFGNNVIGSSLTENFVKVKPKWLDGSPYPIRESPLFRALHGETVTNVEIIFERQDGKQYPVATAAAPMKNSDGAIFAAVAVFEDITERKKSEEALQQAQAKLQEYTTNLEHLVEERTKQLRDSERMAAIGQTAGMVGHDIRNPLQAIVGDLYVLRSDAEEKPDGEDKHFTLDTIESIGQNIDYINKIVSDLQDYAKTPTPTLEEADLEDIIDKAFSTISIPSNIQAQCTIEPNVKLRTDVSYVRRIVTNLTSNAIQAMPNGGKLTVKAKRKDNGKAVQVTVADTGGGIPKEVQDKIFRPLFTTKSKGQGFGLAVVKKFIEALGGTIRFESEADKGTKFIVKLPTKL